MTKLKKTVRKVNNPIPEVRPVFWTKTSFSYEKGESFIEVDMSDNWSTVEGPIYCLAEGIGSMLAQVRKLLPKEEAESYNELVKDLIKEIEQSLIHYS